MRPSASTSATSPRRAAPGSRWTIVRIVSWAVEASTWTARPPSKRTRRSRTTVPSTSTGGLEAVTWPRAHRVEVLEQPRRRGARERDARAALLAQREHPIPVPRGHEVERVLGRMRDPRALDPRIEPEHVDELRAPLVGALGDRAHERL